MHQWARPALWTGWERSLLGAITILGLALRVNDYTAAPDPHDNPDELQFAWMGMSLIRNHVPTTWSYFSEYHLPQFLVTPDGLTWPLVTPWFDHPPLFGLLIGASALLSGAADYASVTAVSVRIPPIVLATACIPLAHLLARRVLGRVSAALGAALFATAPVAVLYGRSVEPEALLAPLLLLALLAVHRLMTCEGRRGTLAFLIACCTIAPLAKVPGITIGGACALILLSQGRVRAAAGAAAGAVLGLAAFAAYGAAYDWNLFLAVFSEQAAHRSGVMGAVDFIADPAGLNRRIRDGWWILGWLGIGVLLVGGRSSPRAALLAWPVLAYAATMLVMADSRVIAFGWYRITIYPLLYLAAAEVVRIALRRHPAPAAAVAVLITGGASAAALWLTGANGPTLGAALLAIILTVVGVAAWREREQRLQLASRWVVGGAFALILAGNIAVSLNLRTDYLRL